MENSRLTEPTEWVSPEVFDAHAHLYRRQDCGQEPPALVRDGPERVGIAEWREGMRALLGVSPRAGGLFFGYPTRGVDPEEPNRFLLSQLARDPSARGALLVSPTSSRDRIEALLDEPRIVGLKPYHVYATGGDTFQAPVQSYLPEWAWELAQERGLAIVLHLVRDRALADEENQAAILAGCRRYPAARLVLAHAGRGFHAPHTVAGVQALRGLENLWFDSSAICEAESLLAILDAFGPYRLLWGSDFPVSHMQGRCVTLGDGFLWAQADTVVWDRVSPRCIPTLVGVESLRALHSACDQYGLDARDRAAIFAGNARGLFGLDGGEREGERTQATYRRAKELMPGGVQLLSKRPEMYAPDCWPAYFREARGCEVWDLDGRHYYDMSTNGIGACLLGYRHPRVTDAVVRRVRLGSMSTLNPPDEVAVAEELCAIHPWASRVRLTRTGGETGAVAVRIARATTDRSVIAICGYSGWHDWYLAANLGESDSLRGHLLPGLDPLGVPRELRGTTVTFRYNDTSELDSVIRSVGDRLAAVVMEPCRHQDPEPGFLEEVRDRAHASGALLVFDEISIGWRRTFGGAHLRLGVTPDIAFFAKALGNGHPMGAVIGTPEAMEGAHGSFISSTYWTEGVGPAAALATLAVMREVDVPGHVERIGALVSDLWRDAARRHGLPVVTHDGYPCMAHFRFDHPESEALRTLYTTLMLDRGFLAGVSIYPTLAHSEEIVGAYGEAVEQVFAEIAAILSRRGIREALRGPVAHSGFRRLL